MHGAALNVRRGRRVAAKVAILLLCGFCGKAPTSLAAAELREAQRLALSVPNTGMVVTTDIANSADLHPQNKQDGEFHDAKAVIEGDTVVVCSPEVRSPGAVRFGWANDAVPNLFNKAGLPASPFRTDDRPATADSEGVGAIERQEQTVRVAGIVLKWIRADKEANCRRAEAMIREAARGGAQLVVTTECFLDGYAIADKSIPLQTYRDLGEPVPQGKYYRRLAALARELKIHLVAGMLEADGELRCNTAVLIGPEGQLVGKYRKQKLEHELVRNTPGDSSCVFETPYGRVGVMICADRREPEIVGRFFHNGADFLICPSGGMFGPKTNDPIVQSRSRENKTHIVFVHPAEFLVTGPDGSILDQTILGDVLLIPKEEVGGGQDQNRVFYFDLPVRARGDDI